MRAVPRASAVLAVIAASMIAVIPAADAKPVDCQYTKAKKLVTLTIANTESTGRLVIEREFNSTRIGYEVEGEGWKRCEDARITNTNKVKVNGSSLSEEIYLSLENGPFTPGASNEKSGAAEIEFDLNLGDGTDSLWLVGGDRNDFLGFPKSGQANLNGDADVDVVARGLDRWYLQGGSGNDTLNGRGAPTVQIWGGEGADRLYGGPGNDDLYGDDGGEPGRDDLLVGNGGNDDLNGYLGDDTLLGGDGDDWMNGHEDRDTMRGGAGDDGFGAMDSKDGADLLDGGPGSDRAYYDSRSANVKVSLDDRADDGGKRERDNVRRSVEHVSGGAGNDTLVGSAVYNDLNGNDGNDVLRGLDAEDALDGDAGNDSLYGGPGDEWFGNESGLDKYLGDAGNDTFYAGTSNDGRDVFSGGPGYDRMYYDSRSNGVTIDVTEAGNDGEPGENDDVKPDFELFVGGTGSDLIVGTNADNYISGGGGAGADDLRGRGGADDLYGNEGNDTLNGGEGYDEIYGSGGDDLVEAEDQGEDYVDCGSGASDWLASADAFDMFSNCEIVPA